MTGWTDVARCILGLIIGDTDALRMIPLLALVTCNHEGSFFVGLFTQAIEFDCLSNLLHFLNNHSTPCLVLKAMGSFEQTLRAHPSCIPIFIQCSLRQLSKLAPTRHHPLQLAQQANE